MNTCKGSNFTAKYKQYFPHKEVPIAAKWLTTTPDKSPHYTASRCGAVFDRPFRAEPSPFKVGIL
ncbi:hypothetical protein J6590_010810 [Homalodisca vitripennis]|nr:hypothetical protein J6590_010810 [Homalodisca vitripennis]